MIFVRLAIYISIIALLVFSTVSYFSSVYSPEAIEHRERVEEIRQELVQEGVREAREKGRNCIEAASRTERGPVLRDCEWYCSSEYRATTSGWQVFDNACDDAALQAYNQYIRRNS